MDLEIRVSQAPGRPAVGVLHLKGRLNLGNLDVLDKAAEKCVQGGAHFLLLDLEQVDSLSSAGLSEILAIAKRLDAGKPPGKFQKSVHVKMARPSANLRRVLDMAGFDQVFEIYGDVETGIASF